MERKAQDDARAKEHLAAGAVRVHADDAVLAAVAGDIVQPPVGQMQKPRHILREHRLRSAVIRPAHQHAALRSIRKIERVPVACGDAAPADGELIRAVQAVFRRLALRVVARDARRLGRHRAGSIQPGLRRAARRAVGGQAVGLLELPDGRLCALVIYAADKRGGQIAELRQAALNPSYLFACHARREHLGYLRIRGAAHQVAGARAGSIQRVVRINQFKALRTGRAVHLQAIHRLEGLRRVDRRLVEFAGHVHLVQIAQLIEPRLVLEHVVALALPLDHDIQIRHARGLRGDGRLRIAALGMAEVVAVLLRRAAVEDRQRALARDAVRRKAVGFLEELDRALRARAELAVRLGGKIPKAHQILLQDEHFAVFVAAAQRRKAARLREDHVALVRAAAGGHGIAAFEHALRTLARDAVRAEAVGHLEGGHGRGRLLGKPTVDAARIVAQLKQARLQEIDIFAAVALAQRDRAGGHGRGRDAGRRLAALGNLLERRRAGAAVGGQAVVLLEGHDGVLRLLAVYAVRHARQIAQLDEAFLQGVNVVARHAQGKRTRLLGIGRRDGVVGVARAGGIELRLRLAARLSIAGKAVVALEGLDRVRRRLAVEAIHAAGIVAQLREAALQHADLIAVCALLEQQVLAGIVRRADVLGLRRTGIKQILRLPAGDTVRRQLVARLEFHHSRLRIGRVFAVDRAAEIAKRRQPRLKIGDVAAGRAHAQHGIARVVILGGRRPALRIRRSRRRAAGRRGGQAALRPVLPGALVAGMPGVRRRRGRGLGRGRRRVCRQGLHGAKGQRVLADDQRIERRIGLDEAAAEQKQHGDKHRRKTKSSHAVPPCHVVSFSRVFRASQLPVIRPAESHPPRRGCGSHSARAGPWYWAGPWG